ncbi:DNA-processing protein DprA [Frankia sp. Ag45/Mut15]|uniref:DNA-processing protein DprA n=1 Tax=Frankia umida TaxID=573489 RepID=A0ABT0JXB2_9ACTN|nr:DNA-processing protein DprA [Frankia umida]MCK9876178.1 DNA-processing protein DprA [Frankia umida]
MSARGESAEPGPVRPGPIEAAGGDASSPERLARVALSRAYGPERRAVALEVGRFGAAAVWERARAAHPGVDPHRDLEAAARVGARLVCPGDPQWPTSLDALDRLPGERGGSLPGAPLCLWVRGPADPQALAARSVAVVGCRAATSYGLHLAGEIAFDLAERGWTIVSGAAFGIDAAAHRAALAAHGRTIAVLAGGVDVPYPGAHARLLAEIADVGAVISEIAPGTPPFRRRFLTRNRVIAALCRATVIVEAGLRSGALNTVAHARRLGRQVLAVPGPVTSSTSAGCHRLLRDFREQTTLVTSADDICEEIADVGSFAGRENARDARDGLSAIVRELLDSMPARATIGLSALAGALRLRPQDVLAMLGPLVVEGLVDAVPGGYRLTELGRAPSTTRRP